MSTPTQLTVSYEQLHLVAFRARTWLLSVFQDAQGRLPMSHLLQVLTGCWICEQTLAKSMAPSACSLVARKIQRSLDIDHCRSEAVSMLLSCDAALVLLSTAILRAQDCDSATLEQFVRQMASDIPTSSKRDHAIEADMFTAGFLLHKLHLSPPPGPFEISPSPLLVGSSLFQADSTTLRSLAAGIAASTAYGCRPASADPQLLRNLAVALPVWLLCYLRHYNLEMGTLLLRAMNYLGLRADRTIARGVEFVLAQQQIDGRFGFLAPEMSRLQSMRPGVNGVLEVYLPTTISCLWAVAELTQPSFILFASC
jgi:hypothetical protein